MRNRCYLTRIKCFQLLSFVAAVLLASSSSIEADIVLYDFVESQTNETVATFELDCLPAFGGDILSISFTTFGESVFGFGASYNDTLESGNVALVDDGMGGLQGSNNIGGGQLIDTTPPTSSLEVLATNGTRIFLIEPGIASGVDKLTFIAAGAGAGGSEVRVSSIGNFVVSVPEPSSALLIGLAGSLLALRRRR